MIIAITVSTLLFAFPQTLLKLTGMSGEVLELGTRFTRIVAIGSFFNMMTQIHNAALRGMGNTITPLFIAGTVNIVVIVLDWILIFGRFGIRPMGVVGSAIATSIGYFVGWLIVVLYYRKYSVIKFHWADIKVINWAMMRKIIRISVPSGMQDLAFSLSRLIVLSMIIHLGAVAFAADQITNIIESVSFMPRYGFAVASLTLVGNSLGAKDYKGAKAYVKISAISALSLMCVFSLVFIFAPMQILSLFITDRETIHLGMMCLMVAAIEQPFLALGMTIEGGIKGGGHTKQSFYIALFTNWCFRLPMIYLVVFVLELPLPFVWGVFALHWMIESIISFKVFRKTSLQWGRLKRGEI